MPPVNRTVEHPPSREKCRRKASSECSFFVIREEPIPERALRQSTSDIYDNIYKNLDARYGDVLGRISNTNTSNLNDINRNAEALSGQASQQMVSRGLGNTTVQQNMQRAIAADRMREATRSNEAFAQLGAGYADRIWQDRTAAQQSKAAALSSLGVAQNSALERVNVGYPDAGMFASLAQMYGAQAEAQKNRKQLSGGMVQQAGGAAGGYTYSPSPWGSRNPAGAGGGWGFGGDSWTGNFQGSNYGGGFYQPQQSATTYADPYTAAMGGAAVYGMGRQDPSSWTSADQSAYEGYYSEGDTGLSNAYLDDIGYY